MTRRKLPPASDWKARDISDWNVTTFHRYLIEKNTELFGAEYVPFGKGPISQRWRTEQGQLKNAIKTYGNVVVRAFIDRCLKTHSPSRDFPNTNFGFIYTYKRDEMARAIAEIEREGKRKVAEEGAPSTKDINDWL
jgi:hypothetical protein